MNKNEKTIEVEKLRKILGSYSVVGIINMKNLPARQLQKIRERLRSTAAIKMSKKTVLLRALGENPLRNNISGECALLLSNENPFKIFRLIKENRAPASAKAGMIAPNNIVVPKGPTALPPGPAISSLQKIGLKTTVVQGKIAVSADKIVCKAGEVITDDMVSAFSLLKIEPIEIGLEVSCILEHGTVYDKSVLDIDIEDYLANLQHCARHAFNLSINAGFITKETAPVAIQKAFGEARSLCTECNIIEKDFIDEILKKAARAAMSIKMSDKNDAKEHAEESVDSSN